MTGDTQASVDNSLAERRRYKRERVALGGRQFEPAENREVPCRIADISPGGARIVSDIVPSPGTLIVVYIDGFGRFEGNVARSDDGGFGIRFNCSAHKRERVAEQLSLYMNGSSLEQSTLRRHDRTQAHGMASFTRANGDIVNCRMLDFSLSGVSLATDIRPPLGEFVLISQTAGRVVRHHENGIGIEFIAQGRAVVESAPPKFSLSA